METLYLQEVIVKYGKKRKAAPRMTGSRVVTDFMRKILIDNSREHVIALYLDSSNVPKSYSLISIGSANACTVNPREIFQRALACGAVSLILAHNHPSGNLEPSQQDLDVTDAIAQGAKLLGMKLLDHIIFSDTGCLSLAETGRI